MGCCSENENSECKDKHTGQAEHNGNEKSGINWITIASVVMVLILVVGIMLRK